MLPVSFYPSLFLQRRLAVLTFLRDHAISSILDMGCGEGELLAVLSRPATWLECAPTDVLINAVQRASQAVSSEPEQGPDSDDQRRIEQLVLRHTQYKDDIPPLHPTFIAGLDTSTRDLAFAISGTAPPPSSALASDLLQPEHSPTHSNGLAGTQRTVGISSLVSETRWEPLKCKIWHGDLQVVNPEFVDVECIVASEVIEHLSEDVFPNFAPVTLGVYHPKYLIITTPSYTFNARFMPPPDAEDEGPDPLDGEQPIRESGYPDPTGRTDRVFRHEDHKFEMTVEEFKSWCQDIAESYGYDVRPFAIGKPIESDPYGRDAELGGASQVAEFIRRGDEESVKKRERAAEKYTETQGQEEHVLLTDVDHLPHPDAQRPRPLDEISSLVIEYMEECREAIVRFEELWLLSDTIAIACGGWVEMLALAIETHDKLTLITTDDPEKRSTWRVQLKDMEVRPLWIEEGEEGQRSVDYIPQGWIPDDGDSEDGSEIFRETGTWGDSIPEEDEGGSEVWGSEDPGESSFASQGTGWGTPLNPWDEEPSQADVNGDNSWIEKSGWQEQDQEEDESSSSQDVDDREGNILEEDESTLKAFDTGELNQQYVEDVGGRPIPPRRAVDAE